MESAKQLIHEANVDMVQMVPKAGLGFLGSFAAMSINDWAGLIVAILTGIYMVLQIEAALKKRKAAKSRRDINQ